MDETAAAALAAGLADEATAELAAGVARAHLVVLCTPVFAMAETLRRAMTINPALKVFVASGYYDLATPYFATVYTFNHLTPDDSLRPNVTLAYYEAGHMMDIHEGELARLKQDVVAFLASALPKP